MPLEQSLPDLAERLDKDVLDWSASLGFEPAAGASVGQWAEHIREKAFDALERTIITSSGHRPEHPVRAVDTGQVVRGGAPARIDLAGGWTDTPPYALEHGGCVLNAAIDLNGQPPIEVCARAVEDPAVTLISTDLGKQVRITELEELLDYRNPQGEFSLAKAALALSGFSPETAEYFKRIRERANDLQRKLADELRYSDLKEKEKNE